ncbi:MAG: hypothetical protein ACRCYO_18860, partial [Bacteroidia bacterium]
MRLPLFIIKYIQFEYWPWWLFYLPILPYWVFLSIKNRSFAYFSVANPGIELGGFFGESKSGILDKIDSAYLPRCVTVNQLSFAEVQKLVEVAAIEFPLIAKPDVGERGNAVAKIESWPALEVYHQQAGGKYLIQEFITYTIELGVLYSRLPHSLEGKVSSVTLKEFLTVTGDGHSTIEALMQQSTRARFQIDRLRQTGGDLLNEVLPAGTQKVLEPIGNHCRGTRFIDANHLINEKLDHVFDAISIPITGFYYGRFDLKVRNIEDLYAGQNIKIMELNGASSEPGHIYDSSNTLFRAYKDLAAHWKRLAEISKVNI